MRAAAVAHERQRDAGERDEPRDAADDDEGLQAEGGRQAGGEQLGEAVGRPDGDAEAAPAEEQVAEDARRRAPSSPISLAMAVKMKSVCRSGTTGWPLAYSR